MQLEKGCFLKRNRDAKNINVRKCSGIARQNGARSEDPGAASLSWQLSHFLRVDLFCFFSQ